MSSSTSTWPSQAALAPMPMVGIATSSVIFRASGSATASMTIETVAEPLARKITEEVAIPTIGIGASAACDGQVLVLEDMLGLSPRTPKFVRRYGDLAPMIEAAIEGYARDVRSREFPGPEHVY